MDSRKTAIRKNCHH